jgi:hypothetical protein
MTPVEVEAIVQAAFEAWHSQPPRDDLSPTQIATMSMYPELEVLADASVRVRFSFPRPVETDVPILTWPLLMARAEDGTWKLVGIGIGDLGAAIERIDLPDPSG